MKTHEYFTMEQHRDMCHKITKGLPNPDCCEGCLLIEEKPNPVAPALKKRTCLPEKLERRNDNASTSNT
jgi:hypothetical protein